MSAFETSYRKLMAAIFQQGHMRPSRVGNTCQLVGTTLGFTELVDGKFPILTTRRMYPRGIWGELAAFLQGATQLSEYTAQGCNYWTDNAAKWDRNQGLPVEEWSVGNIYGAQWRNFGRGVDQIKMLIDGLMKDPYGRRHLLTTYDPSVLHEACLPPCHLLAQFNVQDGRLDLIVYMRSVDVCLGLPADIVLYATLLALIAQTASYKPGRIAFMMGDTHIYSKHSEGAMEQISRDPLPLPGYWLDPTATVDNFKPEMIRLVDYQFHEPIKYELLT